MGATNRMPRWQVTVTLILITVPFVSVCGVAPAQPPAGEYRFKLHNAITNDVRVGIFGFGSDATFRRNLPAGGSFDGDDHLYLLGGDRMIVVWDIDNMGKLVHHKQVTISADIKITITAGGIVVGPY
jgi:hypothetical protein